MVAAGEYVCEVVWQVITALCWLNADLFAELQMETRVSSHGIASLALVITPGQATNLDACGKLGLLLGATGEAGELHPAGAEGTA